ncbi:MAG TPA: pyridoxal-dependent decarboxylase, partial [Dehalococcoidia bacterium]|nr:pyridoxal-dependent decarboxylase [Dehalococcoidia bacterium]
MPQGQTDDRANLELTVDQMRQMSELVVTRILDHFASLPVQPAGGKTGAEAICRSLRADAPETGTPLAPILDRLFDDWIPYSFTTPSAGYLAFISGGGLFPAALADFVAGTTNRFTGIWQAAPVLVQLEANVLDWFRDWMGFPATTRGLLTTGGSSATFNASKLVKGGKVIVTESKGEIEIKIEPASARGKRE